MKPKVIAQAGSRYIIQMDTCNIVIANAKEHWRTGLMWEAQLERLDGWEFEAPKEPIPPVEELLAYPLCRPFCDAPDPDHMRYTPERHGWASEYPPSLKTFQR